MAISRNIDKLQIQNIAFQGKVRSDWKEKLYLFCEKYAHSGIEPKWENYTPGGLDLANHLTFDVLHLNGEIVSFCGIYNGGRYPHGVYRILNRAFTRPDFRSPGLKLRLINSQLLVPYQLARCEKELDLIFISVQETNLRNIFPRLIEQIKISHRQQWRLADGLIKVAPLEIKSCYQNVAYLLLSDRYQSLPLPSIDEEEHKLLPEQEA